MCAGLLRVKSSSLPCESINSWPWLTRRQGFPQAMPFSQTYPMCCINIRSFVEQFYQFADGVAQHHVDIDEVLRKSLDDLLTDNVSKQIARRLKSMSNLSQLAQVVINLEHFTTACDELESVLMNLR